MCTRRVLPTLALSWETKITTRQECYIIKYWKLEKNQAYAHLNFDNSFSFLVSKCPKTSRQWLTPPPPPPPPPNKKSKECPYVGEIFIIMILKYQNLYPPAQSLVISSDNFGRKRELRCRWQQIGWWPPWRWWPWRGWQRWSPRRCVFKDVWSWSQQRQGERWMTSLEKTTW